MKLSDYAEIVAYDIAFWLTALTNPSYPVDQLGRVVVDSCAKLRALAIIALVSQGDTSTFVHNLVRSGRCRATYLQRVQSSGQADHHDASSRLDPFFDAVAAADFALARQIVALSPRDWRKGHEYEDDWCCAQIAHAVLAPVSDVARTQSLFDRWEQVLDGQADARLPVLRALTDRDGSSFGPAFEGLLGQRARAIQAERDRARIQEPGLVAGWQVHIEGLALLRMAVQLKLPTEREYEGCPSLAREAVAAPLPPEW